ncbi:uncharacterized protein C22orf15 homolog isoform X1 [Ursus maritimus]|uniref:Uncharacterized protein C22orf15 homolog isoform X1 n=1 Tax=Ursus maritimus TaxID=29073 RepID=A0A8M1EXF4_URSMA|nr:uncharacterized protein C22orf15 homolog isoform X1 [Ursus maritimus]XP_040475462.1 uncharacterized protein C22orf15 homolog isoform X1 [Ursus maritimus]
METSLEARRASVSSSPRAALTQQPGGRRSQRDPSRLVEPGPNAMFIKVMFGAGCWKLVNTWCSPVTLTAHLRKRGQVPQDAIIALLAEDGHLVSLDEGLEEGASQAPSTSSPLLQERGTYVLVQIITRTSEQVQRERWGWRPAGQSGIGLPPSTEGEGGAPTRYESLLENLDDQYPELAEELHYLSGLHPMSDGRKRRTSTRRGHQEQGPLSRPRRMGSLPSRTR